MFRCCCFSVAPLISIGVQSDMPMTVATPRIAIKDSTLGGLLDKPAKAKWVSAARGRGRERERDEEHRAVLQNTARYCW